jgi:hypothetical protein
MFDEGRRQAALLRDAAPGMTGTEIIAAENNVPAWDQSKDYTGCKAGIPVSDEGQVWLLIIPHNAAHYTGRPSAQRALWGLAHTTDPKMAKPWVAPYGVSGLYMEGECCTYEGHVWRNKHNQNEFPPLTINVEDRWEDLGVVE